MTMRPTALSFLWVLAAGVACSGVAPFEAGAQRTDARPAADAAAADTQTRKIVDAANAFLATLGEAQRKAASFEYADAEQRRRWSNLPAGIVERRGAMWGELDAAQRAALTTLLGAVLSPDGVRMVKEQMDADDELNTNRGAGGGVRFGSDFYWAAFLGAPSITAPWMFQFGGHHLGINATIVGSNVTLAPSLTGGQPVKYDKGGKVVYIVEKEVRQANALLQSLDAAQRRRAVIGARRIDLVLGPGHDGKTLQPEGLPANDMTAAQKEQFVALIEARLGILNADDLAATMTDVKKSLGQTYFAWSGPTEDAGAAYFRATGPTLLLEFSPQEMGGDSSNHLHNMYRNPVNDYGAGWAARD